MSWVLVFLLTVVCVLPLFSPMRSWSVDLEPEGAAQAADYGSRGKLKASLKKTLVPNLGLFVVKCYA
jgi:hypothetical protein